MGVQAESSLCSTCKGAAGCPTRDQVKKPASRCKAFEAFEYFVPAILEGQVQHAGWDEVDRTAGLCGDCGARDTCMFRAREGGTWHCEEYC